MKKRRLSLTMKIYLMMLVIIIMVFSQVLLISSIAYREAVFVPLEERLAGAEVPASELVPFLNHFIEFLGSEELRSARSSLEDLQENMEEWLSEQPSILKDPPGNEEQESRGMLLDLYKFADPVYHLRETLDADEIWVEVLKEDTVYLIYDAVKGGDLYHSVSSFGAEEGFMNSSIRVEDYYDPTLVDTKSGHSLVRCIPLDLTGGEGRVWIRYDMNLVQDNSTTYLHKNINAVITMTVIFSVISLFLLRRYLIRPVRDLSRAATDFTPEEDGTYSADKISKVDVKTQDEIGDLSRSIRSMQENIVENTGHLARMTAERERILTELDLARKIQAYMLPETVPETEHIDLHALMKPAREVGGDFYDYFMIDEDHLALVIADVSGKGIPAAMFMMVAMSLVKTQLMNSIGPAEALARVNRQICERNRSFTFVTVWIGIIELSTGKGIACNAGHENPCVRRAGGTYEMLRYKHDPVVGAIPEAKYHNNEFRMVPGDSLFVFTDGVPEAINPENEQFGSKRLVGTLNRNPDGEPEEVIRRVYDEVTAFADGAAQFDDITMLCMRYKG